MSDKDYKLKVSKFLEYTIFMNHPIMVTMGNKPSSKKIQVSVIDVEDELFVIEPRAEGHSQDSPISGACHFVGSLNDEQVTFSSEVIDKQDDPASPRARYRVKLPIMGLVRNLRSDRRLDLIELIEEEHFIEIETRTGQKLECNFTPIDINKSALSLFINRDVGMVLPGDKVVSVRLRKEGKVLLQSFGMVLRAELPEPKPSSGHSKPQEHVMLVVSLGGALVEKFESQTSPSIDFSDDSEDSAYCFFKTSISGTTTLRAKVISINSHSASIEIVRPKSPLIPGLTISQMQVFLPLMPPFEVDAIISKVEMVEGGLSNEHRLVIVFPRVPTEMHKSIMSLAQTRQNSNLHDLHPDDHGDLWKFLFETGFIYPAKRKQLQEYGKEVLGTYKALLSENNPLVKKVVYKENNRIKGHLSAVRFFDNTWIIQHLNALKAEGGTSAAREVLGAIVSFFVDGQINKKNSTSYISCFYRPNNLYPTMLFGETCSIVNDKNICDFIDLRFCLLSEPTLTVVAQDPPPPSTITTQEATAADLIRLERLLVQKKLYSLMRIENLTREKFTNLDVSGQFETIGLYRFRKVFTSVDAQGKELFAVCNFSSPGINLSELTNSVRFYFSDHESPEANQALANSIMPLILKQYESTKFRHPILLLEADQPLPQGYAETKIYRYWHFDAQKGELFQECAQTIFKNLRVLVTKYARLCEEKEVA